MTTTTAAAIIAGWMRLPENVEDELPGDKPSTVEGEDGSIEVIAAPSMVRYSSNSSKHPNIGNGDGSPIIS